MQNQTVLVLDFGGQYKELIARRVRELNVLSIIRPGNISAHEVKEMAPIGIILTGGPDSVYEPGAPDCDAGIFALGIPVLGLCYGQHLMCHKLGGTVSRGEVGEYGLVNITLNPSCPIFKDMEPSQPVLMSHTDRVMRLPEGFQTVAKSADCPHAAIADTSRSLYAFQFHPEVESTKNGKQFFRNFLFNICKAKGDYTMDDVIQTQLAQLKEQVGRQKVLLALSGGVDSSVCAALLAQALPGQLHCIFVDHGFMRKDEGDEIERAFKHRNLNLVRVNAQSRFLSRLSGVSDPEQKRRAIGEEFIRVFEDEAKKLGDIAFLAQGTIYPDVIESGGLNSANIKSHHNVGGLPENIGFKGIIEPLRGLFKDEVRALGRKLKLPKSLILRQPFPGPGLAIRVIGELSEEKLETLREADAIFREEMAKYRGKKPSQYFAVLTNVRSVGVMGDYRTYEYTLALRAVTTSDFMTAESCPLPHAFLTKVSSRIINEVPHINRVVYDVTGKPPATIEWE